MKYIEKHKQCLANGTATRGPGYYEAPYICDGKKECTLGNCKEADDTFEMKFKGGIIRTQ